jgi:hypothetical protein
LIDPAQITIWAGAAAAVAVVILNWSKILAGAGKLIGGVFRRGQAASSNGIPQRTVVLIPEVQINSLWWHQGSQAGRPALQVVGDFNVTNTWTAPVKLAAAKLRYREGLRRKTVLGMVDVKDFASHYHGRYAMLPNAMTHARVHFFAANTSREEARPLVADIAIVDQFGNEHWIKGLTFKNTGHMLDP